MKKLLFGFVVMTFLVSCTSLPEPESNTNSLVIGSFDIEFHDVYNDSSITEAAGIKLFFTNLTQNRYFILTTDSNGYYYYLTNGSDEYVLTKFEYSKRFGIYEYTMGCPLDIPISTSTAKLIFMGHSTIIFSELLGTTLTTPPQVEVSFHVDWDRTAMLSYLEDKQSDCCWLDYDIIEHIFEVQDLCADEIDD
jgi:hypothetical protein